MRMNAVLVGDVRFQFKYGFYFIYLVFAVLYTAVLFMLPIEWRSTAGIIMIFTDPAAMGLFFMGAIVLYEKSERVLNSIAISPVKSIEYVLSKILSIAVISLFVAIIIGIFSNSILNIVYFSIGVLLCSCLFSSIGLIIACKIKTLNQFMIATVPAEILINIPTFAYLFGFRKSWLLLHPGVCMIELCTDGQYALLATLILLIWTVFFTLLANKVVKKMLQSVGGVNL